MRAKLNLIVVSLLSIIVIISAAIYWQGLGGPFLLDDGANIDATYLSEFSWNEMIYALSHNGSGTFGRPVSILSFTLSGLMHGPESWGYKFHNLLIHLVNGLLIFWLLVKLLPYFDKNLSPERKLLIAGIVTGSWLLHPLLVSTVLYAVQRMAELSAMFTLFALLAYIKSRENITKNNKIFFIGSYLIFPLFLILAMLSKENGVLIPFYVFAIEMIVFQFTYKNSIEKRRVFCFLTVFVFVPVLLGCGYILTHFEALTGYATRNFNVYERLLTESHVIFLYLKLILLPQLSEMSLFHDDFVVIRTLDLLTVFYSLAILASGGLVFVLRKTIPIVSFSLSWFLISHLLESTFFDLELVFEHRNYLALLGLILPVFYYLLRSKKYIWAEYSAYCFLLVLIVLTAIRVQEWKSEDMLYLVALEDHPESVRVHTDYANINYLAGEFDIAIEHLHKVQELRPNAAAPVIHEILMLCVKGAPLRDKVNEAKRRLDKYPITPYVLSTLDILIIAKNDEEVCSTIQVQDMLDMVQIASNQRQNGFTAPLQRLEGILHLMNGNYLQGAEYLQRSYQSDGRVATLFDLAAGQFAYKKYDDVELTFIQLESINEGLFNTEKLQLIELKEKLKEERSMTDIIISNE